MAAAFPCRTMVGATRFRRGEVDHGERAVGTSIRLWPRVAAPVRCSAPTWSSWPTVASSPPAARTTTPSPASSRFPVGVIELEGLKNTRIFNPADDHWAQTDSMTYGRWYPTLVTLERRRRVRRQRRHQAGQAGVSRPPAELGSQRRADRDLRRRLRHAGRRTVRSPNARCRRTRACTCCRTATCSTTPADRRSIPSATATTWRCGTSSPRTIRLPAAGRISPTPACRSS